MKYLLVAVTGLLLGAAAAGVIIYFNPFADRAATPPGATARVLTYSLPEHVLEAAIGEDARLLGHDPGEDGLWEDTIDRTAVLGLVLNDEENRPAAISSRLIATSPDTDLLRTGVVLEDYWLVTILGEGTLFVHATSNAWPFLKETLLPVWYLERPWKGPAEYWPTIGPGLDETASVVGLTGSFGGSTGGAVERYELAALDPERRFAAAKGELYLDIRGPQVAVE
jgi:hypothetical protein